MTDSRKALQSSDEDIVALNVGSVNAETDENQDTAQEASSGFLSTVGYKAASLFNFATHVVPPAYFVGTRFKLWPQPYHMMLEFGAVPLVMQARDIILFLQNTSSPWRYIKNLGAKNIVAHIGRFTTGMTINLGAGAGLGVAVMYAQNQINATPWLKNMVTDEMQHLAPVALLAGGVYLVNHDCYERCISVDEEPVTERNIYQNYLHYLITRPADAALLLWFCGEIAVSAGRPDVALNPHFGLLAMPFDQLMTLVDYCLSIPHPLKSLVPEELWQQKAKTESSRLLSSNNELAPTRSDQMKAVAKIMGRGVTVMAIAAAVHELMSLAAAPNTNEANISYNLQLQAASSIVSVVIGVAAERMISNADSIKNYVQTKWSSLWHCCKKDNHVVLPSDEQSVHARITSGV